MKLETLTKRLKGFEGTRSCSSNKCINFFSNGSILLSYDTIIAIKLKDEIYLTKDWDFSKTTGKHRNSFLNETKKETEMKLNNGVYTLLE